MVYELPDRGEPYHPEGATLFDFDGYYPTGATAGQDRSAPTPVTEPIGRSTAPEQQEAATLEKAVPAAPEARVEAAEPVRRSKPAPTGTTGARPTAKTKIRTAEAALTSEDDVEEAKPRLTGEGSANRLPTVPFSATGGSLILALGVGALLYRRFGR